MRVGTVVSFPRPEVDIRAAPQDFDALIDWLDRVSYRLVLLEEYPLPDLEAMVDHVDRQVRDHLRQFESGGAPYDRGTGGRDEVEALGRLLAADHARFPVSLGQLRWFLHRVREDDRAGHGQALGQYGRLLAEALRRHRDDERRWAVARGRGGPLAPETSRGKR